jgi:hypothetical protein
VRAGSGGTARVDVVADVALADVVGRSVVVHALRDDLGRGAGESAANGNSGARIACARIRWRRLRLHA